MPESKEKYKYILCAICYFSKYLMAIPIKDKTAKSVVKALYIIVNTHQCYEIQINDQGREFCNNVCTEFHKYCGIVQRVTSAYHPQANGLVERVNRTIQNRIAKSVLDIPTDWPDALVGVCGTYNSCIHSSTGFSPYELMYGQKPRRPLTLQNNIEDVLALPEVMAKITIDHCLKEELEIKMAHLKKITELAIQNIGIAQLKQKKDYEKRSNGSKSFILGQKVLAWNHKRSDRKGGKMLNPWIGPYLINKIFDKGVYELITTNNLILKTKYNLSNLKEFIVRNNEYPDENDSSSQNGLYDQIIPLAMEFVDPKSPRAAHVLPIDSGSQNVEFEDKNIQLDRDFINPKTPIELDDDILMINKLENIPRYFFPTTKVWKKYHAKIYGLKPPKRCRDVDYGKQLGEPTILVQIEGDGNCFYRAISVELTGAQNSHVILRQWLAQFMLTSEMGKVIENYLYEMNKKIEIKTYVSNNVMTQKIWASDTEVRAMATMLNMAIFTYIKYNDNFVWARYDPFYIRDNIKIFNNNFIYIKNGGSHFENVLDCDLSSI
ncbi:uncharacterized protein LOC135922911 isoform X1 [Gordionus sp. m RMFG-2023]|uniref:uncharacterized protein LOC135922911 isoform X1 n=1 Tax=Gordionus sp. m RMFG-2023 TaxID=3053472 RepID=UPI0031FDF33A